MVRVLFLVLSLLVIGCGPSSSENSLLSLSTSDNPISRKQWIAKTGRILSGGRSLSFKEVNELSKLKNDEILEALMSHSDFGDLTLDFLLYWTGSKPDQLYRPTSDGGKSYNNQTYGENESITATKNVLNGKSIWSFFQLEQENWIFPTNSVFSITPENEPNRTKEQIVKDNFAYWESQLKIHRDQVADDISSYCDVATSNDPNSIANTFRIVVSGNFPSFVDNAKIGFQGGFLLYNACKQDDQLTAVEEILEAYNETVYFLTQNKLASLADTKPEKIQSVADIKSWRVENPPPLVQEEMFSFFGFWFQNQNSSTNENRRRASQILKRFFCDDLTPLAVEASGDSHDEGLHSSDPACQSCHYKLDPMAGFFKHRGLFGTDLKESELFVFDDGAFLIEEQVKEYFNKWPESGYVRSPSDPSQNTYGEGLEGLIETLKGAPEVKKCFIRTLSKYLLGENQALDNGWIQEQTDTFEAHLSDGQDAFRSAVTTIVNSKTFLQSNPLPGECYDRAQSQTDNPNLIPCEVSHLFEANCKNCHSQPQSDNGYLGLVDWIQNPETEKWMFNHRDSDGNIIDASESFSRILGRLNSNDPDISMPLGSKMPDTERAEMFLWLEQEVQK